MPERAVILTAPEARAAAAGRLGLVVRPWKDQPPEDFRHGDVAPIRCGDRWAISRSAFCEKGRGAWPPDPLPGILSPFGPAGMVLAAKEKWCIVGGVYVPDIMYSDGTRRAPEFDELDVIPEGWRATLGKWRSPATMPLKLARTRLVNRGVSVGHLEDLSTLDYHHMGAVPDTYSADGWESWGREVELPFQKAWNRRYARRPGLSWESNPPVWRCEVERMEG